MMRFAFATSSSTPRSRRAPIRPSRRSSATDSAFSRRWTRSAAQARLAVGLVVVEPDQRPAEERPSGPSRAPRRRRPRANSSGLIDHITPENARIVKVALSRISSERERRRGEARTSSAMRWSGFAISPARAAGSRSRLPGSAPTSRRVSQSRHSSAEALLGEAVDHRGDRRDREDADVEERHRDEARHAALLDRGHEVAADVAVHDVQAVDREQQAEQRREQHLCASPRVRRAHERTHGLAPATST